MRFSKETHAIEYVTAETCPSRKRLYPTRKEARTVARRLGNAGGADRLDAYRCQKGCTGYHIGHHRRTE